MGLNQGGTAELLYDFALDQTNPFGQGRFSLSKRREEL